jgi:Voltage gated chloride channel
MFAPRTLGLSWPLVAFVPLKALAIVLSVTQPLPVGLFSPVFLLGAALGRLFGETVAYMDVGVMFQPWEFSVIGAAALSGGITGAVSHSYAHCFLTITAAAGAPAAEYCYHSFRHYCYCDTTIQQCCCPSLLLLLLMLLFSFVMRALLVLVLSLLCYYTYHCCFIGAQLLSSYNNCSFATAALMILRVYVLSCSAV